MYRIIALALVMALTAPAWADTASLERRVMELEAREAIRNLQLAYGRAVDNRDWQTFITLFARDGGTWDGGMGVATGRDAILKMMVDSLGTAPNGTPEAQNNLHLMTNQMVTITGPDTAKAYCKWTFVMKAADGSPQAVFVGHYEDDLVREDGRWLFKYRKVYADMASPGAIPEDD